MTWYTVTKTINGRKYLYLQMTYRDGANVKTRSQYLGPAGGDTSTHAPANLPAPDNQPEVPLNPYIGRLTTFPQPKGVPRPQPKRKQRPGRKRTRIPKSLPDDGNYGDPFWDTPRSATRLAQQAKLFHLAHRKLEARYNKRSALDKIRSAEARAERQELVNLQETKDFYQRKASIHFDRELTYTKRGVRLQWET